MPAMLVLCQHEADRVVASVEHDHHLATSTVPRDPASSQARPAPDRTAPGLGRQMDLRPRAVEHGPRLGHHLIDRALLGSTACAASCAASAVQVNASVCRSPAVSTRRSLSTRASSRQCLRAAGREARRWLRNSRRNRGRSRIRSGRAVPCSSFKAVDLVVHGLKALVGG